jgi:hypothetical protein
MSWQRAAMALAARGAQSTPTWVKVGIGATLLSVPAYFYFRSRKKLKWADRLDENDVQVAAYYVGLVGPPTIWEKIKKAFNPVEWGKSIGNNVLDFFTGNTVKAIKAGIDRAEDWNLVMKAYKGMTNSSLWGDIGKKLNAEELKEIQKYHEARFERKKVHQTKTATNRANTLNKFYTGSKRWPFEKVMKLGPGMNGSRIEAFANVVAHNDKGKMVREVWLKGEFIGTVTGRIIKRHNSSQQGQLFMELATPKGLFWFQIELLDLDH